MPTGPAAVTATPAKSPECVTDRWSALSVSRGRPWGCPQPAHVRSTRTAAASRPRRVPTTSRSRTAANVKACSIVLAQVCVTAADFHVAQQREVAWTEPAEAPPVDVTGLRHSHADDVSAAGPAAPLGMQLYMDHDVP